MSDRAAQELNARRAGNLAAELQAALPNAGFLLFVLNEDQTITKATNMSPEDVGKVLRDWAARQGAGPAADMAVARSELVSAMLALPEGSRVKVLQEVLSDLAALCGLTALREVCAARFFD